MLVATYTRDVTVTGLPCSGTTISAKILAQMPGLIVDHIVFPESVAGGKLHFKVLPASRLFVVVQRDPAIHKLSLVKNNFATDAEDAARVHDIGRARLEHTLTGVDAPILWWQYQDVRQHPDLFMRSVAKVLGRLTPYNRLELYDGDQKYNS